MAHPPPPQPLHTEPHPTKTEPSVAVATLDVPDCLMTPQQLAAYLGRAVASLADDRCKGVGIPYVKIQASVRYRRSAVEAYLLANTKLGA